MNCKSFRDLQFFIFQKIDNKEQLRQIGKNASRDLYISWEECSEILLKRLTEIVNKHKEKSNCTDTQDVADTTTKKVKSKSTVIEDDTILKQQIKKEKRLIKELHNLEEKIVKQKVSDEAKLVRQIASLEKRLNKQMTLKEERLNKQARLKQSKIDKQKLTIQKRKDKLANKD